MEISRRGVAREAFDGIQSASAVEPIRVVTTIAAVKLSQPKPGMFVYDMGQNLAGWPLLNVTGPAGTSIRLKCGELLNADGTVNTKNVAQHVRSPDVQCDTYTLKGGQAEMWEPRFVFHGSQYVQVEGFPGDPAIDAVKARLIHTDFERFPM